MKKRIACVIRLKTKEKIFVFVFFGFFISFFLWTDLSSTAAEDDGIFPKVVYVHNGKVVEEKLRELVNKVSGEGKVKKLTFSKTNTTALHLIVFKEGGAEKYHFHRRSDLFAIVLKGKGVIIIEGKKFELKKGDQVFIPKGKKHRFINKENGDTWVLVTSSPPLKKEDRHFVK